MNDYTPTEIKIKFVEDEKLKAIVSLKFGKMVIRGFRVMVGQYGNEFWIVPPSYYNKQSKKYHPIFFLEDKDIWQEIQNKILQELDKQLVNPKNTENDSEISDKELDDLFNK